jgi:hypothetical protein
MRGMRAIPGPEPKQGLISFATSEVVGGLAEGVIRRHAGHHQWRNTLRYSALQRRTAMAHHPPPLPCPPVGTYS